MSEGAYRAPRDPISSWWGGAPAVPFHGRHLGGTAGSMDLSRIYDFNFFPVNRTFETVLLLQEQ